MAQQQRQIERMKVGGGRMIPRAFVFREIPGLSREIQEKLERVQPETLDQALRIPGVTPAAVAILDVYLTARTLV
jgi:tRNA uridine 5-carboxymethylaminomethyl modification enzyme